MGKFGRGLNLIPRGYTHPKEDMCPGPYTRRRSDQNEIDQRKQGRADAGGDQGVVGPEVGFRIQQWSEGFRGHFGDLGQVGQALCEAGHIRGIFFAAWLSGTGWQ